jgi:transposase-like protein
MTGTRSTRSQGMARGLRAALDSLPPADTERWAASRKARVVAAVHDGILTFEEACQRYSLSVEEFVSWQRALTTGGVRGLRAPKARETRPQSDPGE